MKEMKDMDLLEVASTTFVLLKAEWPVEKSRKLTEQLEPTHVIVRRTDSQGSQDYYYLYSTPQALDFLTHYQDVSTHEAFGLHEHAATPVLEEHTSFDSVPDQCIVVDADGRLTGFFDAIAAGPAGSSTAAHRRKREMRFSERLGGPGGDGPPLDTPGTGGEPPTQGSSRGPSSTDSVGTVIRSVVAEFPKKVALDETASLLVSLSSDSVTSSNIPLNLPVGTKIDIVVQAKRGFILEGRDEGSLTVSSEDESLPLQFKVKAVELGPGQLRVTAFQDGQALGVIKLVPMVDEDVPDPRRRSYEEPLAPSVVRLPDLSMFIQERKDSNGETVLEVRLTAPDPIGLNLKPYGPIRLRMEPFQYFQEFFSDIENLPVDSSEQRAIAENRLSAKGVHLFQSLLPPDLQRDLWKLRDSIKVVQVQSEEPWIPWELCKLCGREDGRIIEGPFFCEAYALTRWIPGCSQKSRLSLGNMALVVPEDSDLEYALKERDYLLSLADDNRGVERVPATFLDLRRALTEGKYDGWHFSGHGAFRSPDPNRSTMFLEDGDGFTPEDLNGEVSNLGLAQPLVFLNACQIGQSAMSLTDIGGWARQFVYAGAGAFIGAFWSVYDEPSYIFAEAFYDRLIRSRPIGEAAKEARAASKASGDSTWLAYTVFADPLATVQSD